MKLPENIGINKHTIKLEKGKKPPHWPIYSLEPVKLKSLKIYIKTYHKIGFIQSPKFSASTSILFGKKPDSSF